MIVAMDDDHDMAVARLLRQADRRMYDAKERGGKRAVDWTADGDVSGR
jgi:GGDEF domain-containing protein